MDGLADIEMERPQELPKPSDSIVFEPGNHVNSAIINHEKTPHIWNPEVAVRLREYGPEVLTIDGLGRKVSVDSNGNITPIPHKPYEVYSGLPADPSKFQESGVVYVVEADISNVGYAVGNGSELGAARAELSQLVNGKNISGTIDQKQFNREITSESKALALASFISAFITIKNRHPNPMTRRKFLSLGLPSVAALGTLAGYPQLKFLLAIMEAKQSTEKGKDSLQKLVDAVDTSFSVAESIQARNAIMILKTLDAKNRLNSTKKAALIAGSGHAYDMSPLLESEDLCKETVRNFIQKQLSILRPYLAELDVSHEAILHDIKKEIARVRIYRATDRDHTKPYEEGASEVVTISDEFESDRILDALQDISLD